MPIMMNPDGTASHLDWDSPEFQRRELAGEPYWGTILGAIQSGGLVASAFDRPLRSVPVYDASEALSRGPGRLPAPIGRVAEYRVVHANGQTWYHGISPNDVPRAE